MVNKKDVKKNILQIKFEVMQEKIDRLCDIFQQINEIDPKEIKLLEIIRKQYEKMYNEVINREEYEKYEEIESIIIKKISKIEVDLEEYIYDTTSDYKEKVTNVMKDITLAEDYQNFNNLKSYIYKIEQLQGLLKIYNKYLSESELEKIKYGLRKLKFNILMREQTRKLIYENGGKYSELEKYLDEDEKKAFIEFLKQKIKSLKNSYKNDKILKMQPEKILNDGILLDKLIMIDMKVNPYNYINLTKAKIFNAHLCNIGNNPFKREIYITEKELKKLGYKNSKRGLEADKVNFSLLKALLHNVISDDNISIIECEKLYEKFGFKCKPIIVNIGQECVEMIYEKVKKSIKSNEFYEKKYNINKEDKYCKISFSALNYEFDGNQEDLSNDKVFGQLLDCLHQRIPAEEIEKKIFGRGKRDDFRIKQNIKRLIYLSEEELSVKTGKEMLSIIREIYKELNIKYNPWDLVPLEDIIGESEKVYIAPVPEQDIREVLKIKVNEDIKNLTISNIKPLWQKYQKEFKDLGIEIKKCTGCYEGESECDFDIFVNLNDIFDLPIDYKKIDIISDKEINIPIDNKTINDKLWLVRKKLAIELLRHRHQVDEER